MKKTRLLLTWLVLMSMLCMLLGANINVFATSTSQSTNIHVFIDNSASFGSNTVTGVWTHFSNGTQLPMTYQGGKWTCKDDGQYVDGLFDKIIVQFNGITTFEILKANLTATPEGNGASGTINIHLNAPIPTPTIDITKIVDKQTAYVQDEVTYTLTVKNTGNVDLSDVVVADPLLQSNGYIWTIGSLAPNAEVSQDFKYTINVAGVITNTATVTGKYNGVSVTDTAEVGLTAAAHNPAIALVKSVDKQNVDVGDEVEYSFTVTNTGDVPLTGVTVIDPMLGFSWDVGYLGTTVDDRKEKKSEPVQFTITKAGTTTNTATAAGFYGQTQVSATSSVDVVAIAKEPALDIEKSVSYQSMYYVNDTVTYTLTVTNVGNVALENIEVTDPLLGTGVLWTITSLASQASTSKTFSYTIPEAGTVYNKATATTLYNDATISDYDEVSFTAYEHAPGIDVKKTVNKTSAFVGDLVTYTIEVTNTGDVDLSGVTVSDPLINPSEVLWDIGTLKANTKVSKDFNYIIRTAETIKNTATATGTYGNATYSDSDSVSIAAVEQQPAISILKTVNATTVAPGTEVTYTFTVTNTGNVPLMYIEVDDPMFNEGESEIMWEIEELDVGESASTTRTFSTLVVGTVDNTAYVRAYSPRERKVTDQSSASFNVVEIPVQTQTPVPTATPTIQPTNPPATTKPTTPPTQAPTATSTPAPTATPTIQVTPEPTALGPAATVAPTEKPVTIPETEEPKGPTTLPKTAGLPAGVFYGLGGMLSGIGVLLRKKNK